MRSVRQLFRMVVPGVLALAGACAPAVRRPAPPPAPVVGLPPIPAVEGPLAIRVVHPTPQTARPRVDSTYIYGTVGTGRAQLAINGTPVEVRPNGAFLAYLPLPPSGAYELVARVGDRTATHTVAYRLPAPAPEAPPVPTPPAAPVTVEFATPRMGVVTTGADTLESGSDVVTARVSPTGAYRWFLPRGARVRVTGQRAELYRAQLDTATAWLPVSSVRLDSASIVPAPDSVRPTAGAVTVLPTAEWVDLRVPADSAAFLVRPEAGRIVLTLYDRAPGASLPPPRDSLLSSIGWGPGPGAAQLEVALARPVWGYKAFYEAGGDLVLRIRRPPQIHPEAPLRGIRVVVDPGHPPAGATGPTGLTEAEANLAIGLRLAEQLRARGAEVVMTRTENVPVALGARVDLALAREAHLLVSVHNNAFGEGVNPFLNHGTSVYYFHPFSAGLAQSLDREIAGTTRIPDLGAKWGNLALVRPTWMPSALTESLFMLIPEQEAALRDPAFLDRLAAAHVRGIEGFLRTVTSYPLPVASRAGLVTGSW